MKKHISFGIRVVTFMVILILVVDLVNYMITPKKYYEDSWSTTSTFRGFYKMKKNSIDVLFLGSSHGSAAFSPQTIYDDSGIRSYNLGSEQQNLLVSYYWLKEALRYQKPQAVVVELYMLYDFNPKEPLNTAESFTRMAIDAMNWSEVKLNAIKDICKYDNSQSINSYIFKNERFHTRWMNLNETDFEFMSLENHYELKGFAPLSGRGGVNPEYEPYTDYDNEEYTQMNSLMADCLEHIVNLCQEEGIQVILVKTPTKAWSTSKHNSVEKFAEEKSVDFIDFNINEYYEASKFKWKKDMSDDWHCNVWGAEKLSKYIGNLISDKYNVAEISDEQWDDTEEFYRHIFDDCEIQNINDIKMYLGLLNNPRYTVFLAGQSDITGFMDDETLSEFANLGFILDLPEGNAYYAIKNGDKVEQAEDSDELYTFGSIRNSKVDYSIVSEGEDTGEDSCIIIDNEDYSLHNDGINIVVYCNHTRRVIDAVTYDGSLYR